MYSIAYNTPATVNQRNRNPVKTSEIIENNNTALELKEKGNDAFKRKKYEIAERLYSDALQLKPEWRHLWTNRAICRNTMKKHDDALADCLSALSIDSKCKKARYLTYAE